MGVGRSSHLGLTWGSTIKIGSNFERKQQNTTRSDHWGEKLEILHCCLS